MAMIDYGALLKVNGAFLNKNSNMFMEVSDCGYMIDTAKDCIDGSCCYGKEIYIKGNYFVYAGDKDFMLAFYKTMFYVIVNDEIIKYFGNGQFKSETIYINNHKIKVSHLDKKLKREYFDDYHKLWKDELKEIYVDAKGNESLSELKNGYNEYKKFLKRKKFFSRHKGICYKYYSNKYIAEWEHNEKKYEVIFGYGIENKEEVYNNIKYRYDYSDTERDIIDKWFKGE